MSSNSGENTVPSTYFCETGKLENGEKYNQNYHFFRSDKFGRCNTFYSKEYFEEVKKMNIKQLKKTSPYLGITNGTKIKH